jgi:prepilin peptidase CpaA
VMFASLTLQTVVLISVLLSASISDLRERRIPNDLIIIGLALGLSMSAVLPGGSLLESVLGAFVGFLVYLPFFLFGWMGAGDVKLLSVVGAHTGWLYVLTVVPFIALIGGLVALAVIYYNRQFLTDHKLPYAVPILFGVLSQTCLS